MGGVSEWVPHEKVSEQCRVINYASALLVIMILIKSIDSYEVASS